MTYDEEIAERRMLRSQLERMSFDERLHEQLAAQRLFNEAPPGTEEGHWAAHRFINITCYRSFGRLDVPCRHRYQTKS